MHLRPFKVCSTSSCSFIITWPHLDSQNKIKVSQHLHHDCTIDNWFRRLLIWKLSPIYCSMCNWTINLLRYHYSETKSIKCFIIIQCNYCSIKGKWGNRFFIKQWVHWKSMVLEFSIESWLLVRLSEVNQNSIRRMFPLKNL